MRKGRGPRLGMRHMPRWIGVGFREHKPLVHPQGALVVILEIRHKTTYRYRRPVSLGPHRLMLRPRESRDLRLISSDVAVTPAAAVSWALDVSGNAVATAVFQVMTDHLAIDSVAQVQLD